MGNVFSGRQTPPPGLGARGCIRLGEAGVLWQKCSDGQRLSHPTPQYIYQSHVGRQTPIDCPGSKLDPTIIHPSLYCTATLSVHQVWYN